MSEKEQELLHRLLLNLFLESPRRAKLSKTENMVEDTPSDTSSTKEHITGGNAHAKETKKTVHTRGTV